MAAGAVATRGVVPWHQFPGWQMVITGGIISAFVYGTYTYGISVYLPYFVYDLGFGWTAIGLMYSFTGITGGIESPVTGWLIDRLGARLMLWLTLGIGGIGWILMGMVMTELWHLYVFFAVIVTLSYNSSAYYPVWKALAGWFARRSGTAMGLVTVIAILGAGPIALSANGYLVQQVGAKTALVWLGVLSFVMAIFGSNYRRGRAEQYGYLPDNEAIGAEVAVRAEDVAKVRPYDFNSGQSLRTPAFWILAYLNIAYYGAQTVLGLFVIVWLTSLGIDKVLAAVLYGWMFAFGIPGRLLTSFASDRLDQRGQLHWLWLLYFVLLSAGMAVGVLSTMAGGAVFGAVALAVYGLGYGGGVSLFGISIAKYFGEKNYALIQGWLNIPSFVAWGGLPLAGGWILDNYPTSFTPVFIFMAIWPISGFVASLFLRRPAPPVTAR